MTAVSQNYINAWVLEGKIPVQKRDEGGIFLIRLALPPKKIEIKNRRRKIALSCTMVESDAIMQLDALS